MSWAFRRSDLAPVMLAMEVAFTKHVHREWFPVYSGDGDPIQVVNKTGQWGLAHQSLQLAPPGQVGQSTTFYLLRRPLMAVAGARRGLAPGDAFPTEWQCPDQALLASFAALAPAPGQPQCLGTSGQPTKAQMRADVIAWLMRTFIDVPLDQWTHDGHADPINQTGPRIAQPQSYNRAMRNTFKFDRRGIPLSPSADHLCRSPDKFYTTVQEKQDIIAALQKSLATKQPPPAQTLPTVQQQVQPTTP